MKCRYCDEEVKHNFPGKSTMFCDKRCKDLFYYIKRRIKEGKPAPKGLKGSGNWPEFQSRPKIKKICPVCGVEFEVVTKRGIYCGKKCRSIWHYNGEVNDNIPPDYINKVGNFLKELRRKIWWADMGDIFRIIDFHSIIFPGKSYEDNIRQGMMDREEVFNRMVLDLVKWWKKKINI
jgi:hypothetical protein